MPASRAPSYVRQKFQFLRPIIGIAVCRERGRGILRDIAGLLRTGIVRRDASPNTAAIDSDARSLEAAR